MSPVCASIKFIEIVNSPETPLYIFMNNEINAHSKRLSVCDCV